MQNAAIIILLVFILIFALNGARKRIKGGCCGSGGEKVKKVNPCDTNTANYPYKVTAFIDGMTCNHCKLRVENAFNSLPFCFASVKLKEGSVEIFSKKELSESDISAVVQKEGYRLVRIEKQ